MKLFLFIAVLLIITNAAYSLESEEGFNISEAEIDQVGANRNKRDDFNIEDFKLGQMVKTKPEDVEMEKKKGSTA